MYIHIKHIHVPWLFLGTGAKFCLQIKVDHTNSMIKYAQHHLNLNPWDCTFQTKQRKLFSELMPRIIFNGSLLHEYICLIFNV